MFTKVAAVFLGIIVLTGAGLLISSKLNLQNTNQNVVCIQDVKICPDGTSVGRIPPKCEFAACPKQNQSAGFWKL